MSTFYPTAPATRSLHLTALKKATYRVGHGHVICTLYHTRCHSTAHPALVPEYALGMRGSCGTCLYFLGADVAQAKAAFELVVKHTVTPCTLGDVLADLAMAEMLS